MSNIEKIGKEIERRKNICEGIFERESDTYYQGKAVAYGELLAFIDSLPEEDLYAEVGDTEEDYIKRSMAKVNECRKMICEDSLQVPETCKENAESFTSLEEVLKRYNETKMKDNNLTWQDIQMIVAIADHLLEVLKPGEHAQKYPTDESYYSAVLDEYNRLHQTKA